MLIKSSLIHLAGTDTTMLIQALLYMAYYIYYIDYLYCNYRFSTPSNFRQPAPLTVSLFLEHLEHCSGTI